MVSPTRYPDTLQGMQHLREEIESHSTKRLATLPRYLKKDLVSKTSAAAVIALPNSKEADKVLHHAILIDCRRLRTERYLPARATD